MRQEIEEAIRLLKSSEPESLDRALALLQETVFSFGMKVCGQRQDAEDTMQEVLLKSIPQLPKLSHPKALLVWLYKVAKNHCLMNRRRSKFASKKDLSLEELMPDRHEIELLFGDTRETPESAAMRREGTRQLREAVQKLPPEYRLILVLHDMEELSDEDIAEITGLRHGTIRVRLHRARLFVRKHLAERREGRSTFQPTAHSAPSRQQGSGRCKALFAELSNYLDEELDESLCEELEKHLTGCQPCEAFLQNLKKSIEQCRTMPSESPNPHVAAKLRRELISDYQELMRKLKQPAATHAPSA